MIGGVLIGVGGAFYLIRDKQPNVDKSDHAGQASIRTDTPNIAQMNTKDIPAEANANESELPNDAPNNPENKEKVSAHRCNPSGMALTPCITIDGEEAAAKTCFEEGRSYEIDRKCSRKREREKALADLAQVSSSHSDVLYQYLRASNTSDSTYLTDDPLLMSVIKSLHHSTSICERRHDDTNMHQLVTRAEEVEPSRVP